MYRYLLTILILAIAVNLHGKIVNGYETNLVRNLETLSKLKLSLTFGKTLSLIERLTIKSKIKAINEYIVLYELTDALIDQLKKISPALYYTAESIEDKKGRPTDIYVKLIPREKAKFQMVAASFLHHKPRDHDMAISEYGENTASIEISITRIALLHFAHELGHVTYIIPNLACYTIYYKRAYLKDSRPSYIGHNPSDLSGKQAEAFQRELVRNRKQYILQNGTKPESPPALMVALRRSTRESHEHQVQLVNRTKSTPLDSLMDWKK